MALSAFTDKTRKPSEEDLKLSLAEAHGAWTRLIELVAERVDAVSQVWGYTSASTGWGLRLKRKDRIIAYMTPGRGQFLVSFALGEKAVAAARTAKLPKSILREIDAAPKFAEGRGVRFTVRNDRDLAALAVLAQIKNEH